MKKVIDAHIASSPDVDRACLVRFAYWVSALGDRELADITSEDVDQAMVTLAERGRLKPG